MSANVETSPFATLIHIFERAVLSNERWSNGQVVTWKDAPSYTFAKEKNGTQSKRIRFYWHEWPDAIAISAAMSNCMPGMRCGFCYMCTRVFQQWVTRESVRLHYENCSKPFDTISIVPPHMWASPGALRAVNLDVVKADLTTAFDTAGFRGVCLLGLDISFNDDTQWRNGKCYWQFQFRGLIEEQRPDFLGRLTEALGHKSRVFRSVDISDFDGSKYGASYSLKTYADRRVRYVSEELAGARTRTKTYGLKAKADAEWMLFMHDIGLYRRLYLRNIETVVDGHSARMRRIE